MNNKLFDKFLFNFLAKDAKNAADIIEAGLGYVVPGIVSNQFVTVQEASDKVNELKTVTSLISVGLGGNGDVNNWKKVRDISAICEPGHLNQPFETAVYTKGFLDAQTSQQQVVNALIKPTGQVGKIMLASGTVMDLDLFLDIAASLRIESIKMMPLNGDTHIEELIVLTKEAAKRGIRGIEPAGGINSHNIDLIIDGVKNIDIEFFMPHIFGSTIDKETGETIPEKVKEIIRKVVK